MGGLETVLTFVGPVVGMFVVYVVRGRLRERRIGSQVEQLATSGHASLALRVRGDIPYPHRWEACRLVIDPDGAVLRFRERHLPDVRLPAGRVEVLHVRAAGRSEPVRDDDDLVVISVADGAGSGLSLLVPEETVGGVVEVIERADVLTGPALAVAGEVTQSWRRWAPTWALIVAAAGLLVGVLVGGLWVASEPVQVQLTGAADEYDYCPVAWADPWDARPQDAQISCSQEQPGEHLAGLALPAPFRGEIFDTESFPFLMLLGPLPLLLAAGAGAVRRVWLVRGAEISAVKGQAVDGPSVTGGGIVPPLPSICGELMDADTAGEVAAARSVRERWTHGPADAARAITARDAENARWWTLPPLRRIIRHEAARSSGALFFVGLALVGGWTAWGGWLGTRGEVQVARAMPDEEAMGTFPFLPDDLEVTFAVPTGEESALVALVGDVPDADALVVLYSVDDPQRARLVGESDGTGRGMLLSGILGAGGLAWIAWCLHGAATARREILGALRDHRRADLDYVLSADPEGDPVLLLWTPGATAPGWAVSLAEPLLGVIPVRGTVEVRGALGDERPLVPVLPDRVLWPASRAMELDRELALVLISGEPPNDEVPEGDDHDLSQT